MNCLLLICTLLLTPLTWANPYLYINLSIELTPDRGRIYPGDSVTFVITVDNPSTVTMASNGVVTVRLPEGTADIISADCIEPTAATLLFTLAELPPQSNTTPSFTASAAHEGHYKFGASLTSAAIDTDNTDDSNSNIIVVSAQTTTVNTTPVDLAIVLSAASETGPISRLASFTATTTYLTRQWRLILRLRYRRTLLSTPVPPALRAYRFCVATRSPWHPGCRLALKPVSVDPDATIPAYVTTTQPDLESSDTETQLLAEIIPAEILCGAGNPRCYVGAAGTDGTTDTPDAVAEPCANRPSQVAALLLQARH